VRKAIHKLRTRNSLSRRVFEGNCAIDSRWLGVRDDFRNWLLTAA
jgi:hypothetical protein